MIELCSPVCRKCCGLWSLAHIYLFIYLAYLTNLMLNSHTKTVRTLSANTELKRIGLSVLSIFLPDFQFTQVRLLRRARGHVPSQRSSPHCQTKFFVQWHWTYEMKTQWLYVVCFYAINCIFEHTSDRNFPVTGALSDIPASSPPTPRWGEEQGIHVEWKARRGVFSERMVQQQLWRRMKMKMW